jgi:hypothetical protein
MCGCLVVFILDTKVFIFCMFLWKRKWLLSAVVNKNKSRIFVYNLNEKWGNKYFFINVNNKCVYLICNVNVAVSKKCNAEQRFMTMHTDYVSKYSNKSKMHRNKTEDLKYNAWPHLPATIASYKITEILAKKNKKPFEDGNVIKECLIVTGNFFI